MKKIAWHICSLMGMMFLLTVVSAQAQTIGRYRAHIPFDFTIEKETYQAGDYVIALAKPGSDLTTLQIINLTNGKSRLVQTMPKSVSDKLEVANLVFNRYGDQYFLKQILTPDYGVQFFKAKTEKRLANNQQPQQQLVALR
jgi:hypothetical protein